MEHVRFEGVKHGGVERSKTDLNVCQHLCALKQQASRAFSLAHHPLDHREQVGRKREVKVVRRVRQGLGFLNKSELAGVATALPAHTVPMRLVPHSLLHRRIVIA